jgi:hypothetical protein
MRSDTDSTTRVPHARTKLKPRVGAEEGGIAENLEVAFLRHTYRACKWVLLARYCHLVLEHAHERVWDEHVDVGHIQSVCRCILVEIYKAKAEKREPIKWPPWETQTRKKKRERERVAA